jgi:hypothetical protein
VGLLSYIDTLAKFQGDIFKIFSTKGRTEMRDQNIKQDIASTTNGRQKVGRSRSTSFYVTLRMVLVQT